MAGFILKSLALWMSTGWSTSKVSGEKTLKMVQSTNITKKKKSDNEKSLFGKIIWAMSPSNEYMEIDHKFSLNF